MRNDTDTSLGRVAPIKVRGQENVIVTEIYRMGQNEFLRCALRRVGVGSLAIHGDPES